MKYTALFLLIFPFLGLSAQADEATPPDPLGEKIEQLLKLSGAEAQFLVAIDQMIQMQKSNPIYDGLLPEGFWSGFSAEAHKDAFQALLPGMIDIYKKHLTEEEIDHQIAYLGSPVTQRIVAKQPMMTQEAMGVGQEWGRKMGEQIALKLQQAVEDRN